MKVILVSVAVFAAFPAPAAPPSITIYNQNFAVVRDSVPLDLRDGLNTVRFADTTAHVEPDSVILRDPRGAIKLQIIEQNYRNDPVSDALLLNLYEGRTINFVVKEADQPERIVQGKIIRSGYVPHSQGAMRRYGNEYYQGQMAMAHGTSQPVIEVNGEIQFQLPGLPRFPKLADDTILKPAFDWKLRADKPGKLDAELCYVTAGMSWEADYNVVAPEKGDDLDLTGWITMDNQSGKTFPEAKVKLIAGDVSKLQPDGNRARAMREMAFANADTASPPVKEKAFDEYHLYTLNNPTTLHDRETKQVEFIRSSGVKSERIYVYDGVQIDANQYRGYNMESIRAQDAYGTQSNPKVWVMREFKNNEANRLGIPLPKGRVRFYRQDDDGQLQFVGENLLDHTPKDELVRIYTGNAFDIAGERKRTRFKRDNSDRWVDETFEIKLRNHKKETVEVRVAEHLYRWTNWEIRENSNTFLKTSAQAVEFRIPLKPDEERVITYTVHYSW